MPYRKFTPIVILMQSNIRYWGTNVNRFLSGHRVSNVPLKNRLFLRLLYIFVNGMWSQRFSFLRDTIKYYSVAVSSGTVSNCVSLVDCILSYIPSRTFFPGTKTSYYCKHGVHNWFIQHVRQLRTSSTFVTTDISFCTTRKSDIS